MTHSGVKLCSCSYYTKMFDFHCSVIEAVYKVKLQNALTLKGKEEWKLLTMSMVTGKYKGFL